MPAQSSSFLATAFRGGHLSAAFSHYQTNIRHPKRSEKSLFDRRVLPYAPHAAIACGIRTLRFTLSQTIVTLSLLAAGRPSGGSQPPLHDDRIRQRALRSAPRPTGHRLLITDY